jgi:tetratricopeptide (TPR) repeat protein
MSRIALEIKPLKDRAASAFKAREYLTALNTYEEALHLVNQRNNVLDGFQAKLDGASEEGKQDPKLPSPGELEAARKEVRSQQATLYSNVALCHMKREEYLEAGYYVKRCLEIEPTNVKA